MNVRRVVTGKVGGKAKIISDGGTRRSRAFKNIPGQSAALIWSTAAVPSAPVDGADIISEKSSYLPVKAGETRLMIVTFAPDSVMMSIDPVKIGDRPPAGEPHLLPGHTDPSGVDEDVPAP